MKIVFILVLLSITGCASQKFDCPFNDGVKCMSLSEVDKMRGKNASSRKLKDIKKLTFYKPSRSTLRTEEEVLTIWMAPYRTEDGTLFEEKIMHIVAKPAEWVALEDIKSE